MYGDRAKTWASLPILLSSISISDLLLNIGLSLLARCLQLAYFSPSSYLLRPKMQQHMQQPSMARSMARMPTTMSTMAIVDNPPTVIMWHRSSVSS